MNTPGIFQILVPGILSLILALVVFYQNKKNPLNLVFGLLCGVNFLYHFVLFLINQSSTHEEASFFLRFNFVWTLTGFVGVFLIHAYLEKTTLLPKKMAVWFLFLVCFAQFLLQVFFVDRILGLTFQEDYGWDLVALDGPYTRVSTSLFLIFLFYLMLEVSISLLKKELNYAMVRLAFSFMFMMLGIIVIVLIRDVIFVYPAGYISGVVLIDLMVTATALYGALNQNFLNFDLGGVSGKVIEAMSNFLFLVNRNGEVVENNLASQRLLNFSKNELRKIRIQDLLPEFERLVRDDQNGNPQETYLQSQEGNLVPVILSVTQVFRKKTFIGYIITGSDLTEIQHKNQKLAGYVQQLEAKNRLLKDFNYLLSHDLKEPLRNMGAFSSLLIKRYEPSLDEKARDYLGFIAAGSNRITELINGLTEIINLDKNPVNKQIVPFERVLSMATDNLSQFMTENQAILHKPAGREPIYVDALQFSQVFQNLLVNAVRYHRPGVLPEIEISLCSEKNAHLIKVQDNGRGIEPDRLSKVFNLFYRGTKEHNGSGIGLSICRRIVENHQGHIWVESTPGKGSTFFIHLPKFQPKAVSFSLES